MVNCTCSIWVLILFFLPTVLNAGPSGDQLVREYLTANPYSLGDINRSLEVNLKPSSAFSISGYPNARPDDDQQDRLNKFLSQFNEKGLQPVRLLMRGNSRGEYSQIYFPGCDIGECSVFEQEGVFLPATVNDYNFFLRGPAGEGIIFGTLESLTFGGLTYDIDVSVFRDQSGQMTKFNLSAMRNSTGFYEKLRNQLNSGGGTERSRVFFDISIIAGTEG